jgi:hypothetical protein
MRASVGVNWHLGWSSRNAETINNAKSALEAYCLLDFSPPAMRGPCIGGTGLLRFFSSRVRPLAEGKEMKRNTSISSQTKLPFECESSIHCHILST